MPFFSKVFKGSKEPSSSAAKKVPAQNGAPKLEAPKPRWEDAWLRTSVEPDEVQELLRECTHEIKARAVELPFLILPFRPSSDSSAAKTFIRNFFGDGREPERRPTGEQLAQEVRLVEPLVLCSIVKWCWSRLPGGVVTWEAYELFTIGEKDSKQARDAFNTFIPMSVASPVREKIIFDFFELLAAIAAHGKLNGLGGRKLPRLAGWWAFEHPDPSSGFDSGYKSWLKAADATSHLFFAYLRSLTPKTTQERSGVTLLPRALEALLESTEYPPVVQTQLQSPTSKVLMIVENVSPTPFALLHRAKNFHYRDEDFVLQRFSEYDDPADALTDECLRVLRSIAVANDKSTTKDSAVLKEPSWSRFEDLGFASLAEETDTDLAKAVSARGQAQHPQGIRTAPQSKVDLGRPTTPSWADFLSSGFVDDQHTSSTVFLPPDKVLPPINMRGQSSQSHRRMTDDSSLLEPGELANITRLWLDDAFWWAWITSLSAEEPLRRKAVFGRCALIETRISGDAWLIIEENVKGAAPEQPVVGAYVAEKKSRFSLTKKLSRTKSSARGAALARGESATRLPPKDQASKTTVAPDQQARIQAAAAALQEKQKREEEPASASRRGRVGAENHQKTQSVMTVQPTILREATPAMKWASSYDKNTIRAQYLGNDFAGRGSAVDLSEVLSAGRATSPEAAGSAAGATGAVAAAAGGEALVEGTNAPREVSSKEAEQTKGAVVPLASTTDMPPPPPPKSDATDAAAQSGSAKAASATQQPAEKQTREQGQTEAKDVAAAAATKPAEPKTAPPPPPKEANGLTKTTSRTTEVTKTTSRSTEKDKPAPVEKVGSRTVIDPAGRPGTPEQQTKNEAAESPNVGSSPETSKSDRNRLQKKKTTTGKGIKGILGLKKNDDAAKPPARAPTNVSSSVAAARAALEAKAKESQASSSTSPSNRVTTKRFSTVGNKGPVEETAAAKSAAKEEEARPEPPPKPAAEPAAQPRVAAVAQGGQRPTSTAESSQVDPAEEERAREAFGSFDQGSIEPNLAALQNRAPAAALAPSPEVTKTEKPEHAEAAAAAAAAPTAAAAPEAPLATSHAAEGDAAADGAAGAASKEAEEANAEPAVPVSDRWAQIRKNAAERAARMSDDPAVQPERVEDGDEAVEESMEERVARIRAHVAEIRSRAT